MNKNFWKTDWFAGLVVSLAFLLAASSSLLQGNEHAAYDWGVWASSDAPGDKIFLLANHGQIYPHTRLLLSTKC